MCRHIYYWNIVNCDVKQQIHSLSQITTQKRHQNFDNTTIVDLLGIVSWSNNSHPTVVVKPVYGIQPSH